MKKDVLNVVSVLLYVHKKAREIKSDLDNVKKAINSGKKIIASLAPSSAGFFDVKQGIVVSALKKLGFNIIEETAVGAEIVAELYNEYIKNNKQDVYITTACPSANYLVENIIKNSLNI